MPVVIGGWDSYESFQAAMERGETPAFIPENYVGPVAESGYVIQPGLRIPATAVGSTQQSVPTSSGFLGAGLFASASPGLMVNAIESTSLLGGAWSGFDAGNIAGGLAILHAYAIDAYGSVNLGVLRRSSEVLENEPTGIRPGTMERIVIPVWARNERGSPI